METFSTLLTLYEGNSLVTHHKGQWRGTLMFSLICAWTNGRVNNRDTGDLRRHRAHYDVTVMEWCIVRYGTSGLWDLSQVYWPNASKVPLDDVGKSTENWLCRLNRIKLNKSLCLFYGKRSICHSFDSRVRTMLTWAQANIEPLIMRSVLIACHNELQYWHFLTWNNGHFVDMEINISIKSISTTILSLLSLVFQVEKVYLSA